MKASARVAASIALVTLIAAATILFAVSDRAGREAILAVLAIATSIAAIGVIRSGVRRSNAIERIRKSIAETPPSQLLEIDTTGFTRSPRRLVAEITEWQRALLGESERSQLLRAVLTEVVDGLDEGVLAIDRDSRIVLANERASQLFAVPPARASAHFLTFIRSERLAEAFATALRGEGSSFVVTVDDPAGARSVRVSVVPLRESTDLSAVAFFSDVTRIERLERIRRDFLDDFSHEVRTPLAGLRSAVETLELDSLSDSDRLQLLAIVVRQLNRLERIVESVGELSRLESREITLSLAPVDLAEIAEGVASELAEQAHATGAELIVSGSSGLVTVDRSRIEQVFVNLVDNALKHGGNVGRVAIGLERGSESVTISISDDGQGIPPEEQSRIFNRFYRVDRSRSQSVPGTGLGLAISRHIVAAHGGTLSVQSTLGSGATFTVTLPIRRPDREEAPSEASEFLS